MVEVQLSASAETREIGDSADSRWSPGESGPVREGSRASARKRVVYSPDQDIVQRSASEQTLVSLCIWYSKPMLSSAKMQTLVRYGLAELCNSIVLPIRT